MYLSKANNIENSRARVNDIEDKINKQYDEKSKNKEKKID